jgi:hypothetical protein
MNFFCSYSVARGGGKKFFLPRPISSVPPSPRIRRDTIELPFVPTKQEAVLGNKIFP